MRVPELLREARRRAGMSSRDLADAGRTVRTAVSAYENGRKSPTGDTLERLIEATGSTLTIEPAIHYSSVMTSRGRGVPVPDRLPRLPLEQALADIELPLSVAWSGQRRALRLSNRQDRVEAYRALLSEGTAQDIATYVDGALLVDAWDELLLPREVEAAWEPVVRRAVGE